MRTTYRQRSQAAFTMVEIALSLGIIAFALVAIIGVMPSGMKVQRENREDTIINQDGSYLLEAIRSGSKGVDDLTNYVESITVNNLTFTNNLSNPGGYLPLTNAQHIVSLLSTPKVEWLPNNTYQINTVTARMRALSGNAMEKSTALQDFAFRYQVTAEVVALTNVPPLVANNLSLTERLRTANLMQNAYEVRLLMRWPILQRGGVGRNRRTLRTLVSGELMPIYTNKNPHLFLFQPDTFASYH